MSCLPPLCRWASVERSPGPVTGTDLDPRTLCLAEVKR